MRMRKRPAKRAGSGLTSVVAALFGTVVAGPAFAQCCAPPPPPCCQPPPPPPPPDPAPCCHGPSVSVPGISVSVGGTAVVVAGGQASAFARGAGAGTVIVGGGGGGFAYGGGAPVVVPDFAVEAWEEAVARKVVRTRLVRRSVFVQAVCLDDRGVPHPAARVRPDREVAETFAGELFRCVVGTRLQIVTAEREDFSGGETLACAKGEALWHEAGRLTCRVQTPARDCNERSLLRRYGAGIKVVTLLREETYEETVTETAVETRVGGSGLVLDGGVGARPF